MTTETVRYTRMAAWLHWLIALALVGNILGGWIIEDAPLEIRFDLYQWHKTFGILVLFLTLVRIAWRFMNPPPPLPADMAGWERTAARLTHILFYALMLALPLTGWAMVSVSVTGVPTMLFNVLPWPHLPLGDSEAAEELLYNIHGKLAWGVIGLLALHIGAGIKHHFINRDGVLARMVPGLRQAGSGGFARRRGGVGVIGGTLALFALIIAIPLAMPGAPSSAQLTTNDGGNWIVDPELSQIIVSGTHAGKPFAAQFTDWRADIRFDPEAPEAARVEVVVDAAAVETGNSYYDNTLKESGWLAPSTFPVITFVSQDIAGASTGYAADGELTIRDTTLPAQLVFTLDIEGDTARMEGRAEISRLAYGVGNAADPKAEWVSDELIIDVAVTATRGEADQP